MVKSENLGFTRLCGRFACRDSLRGCWNLAAEILKAPLATRLSAFQLHLESVNKKGFKLVA